MSIVNIAAAFSAIPLFYLIYYRYFIFRPVWSKHIQAFAAGILAALLMSLFGSFLNSLFVVNSEIITSFIKAALLEKTLAFVFMIFIFKHFRDFSVLEAVLTSMMFGLGFAAAENILYAFTYSGNIVLIRILFSTPLHLTTCGILGYYLGNYKIGRTQFFRTRSAITGFLISFILHGSFDFLLLRGGYASYIISPLLIMTVVFLENLMARAQTLLPVEIINALQVRFEDYMLINKQKKYERWIKQSMGLPDVQKVTLFLWRPGIMRMLLFVGFLFLAVIGVSFREEFFSLLDVAIRKEEEILMLGVFPSFIGLSVIVVGSINPDFFKVSELKIPVITDVEIDTGGDIEETLVTYDVTASNCFLRTSEPLGKNHVVSMKFSFQEHYSHTIEGTVVWENHTNKNEAMGTVIRIDSVHKMFWFFLLRYNWFRFRKGIVFNLKLPGFESTRKLFMRPISAVEEDVVYHSGDILFHEGEVGEHFYLLKKGCVILYKKKSTDSILTIDTIDQGQILGEMSIARKSRHSASAICVGDCIVGIAEKKNLNALLMNNIDFSRSFIDTLVERIEMSEKILVEYIQQVESAKKENERFFHASLMMILLNLGFNPTGVEQNHDIKKLGQVIKKMSPADMGELINLITYKLTRKEEEMDAANRLVSSKLKDLYSKFEIDI